MKLDIIIRLNYIINYLRFLLFIHVVTQKTKLFFKDDDLYFVCLCVCVNLFDILITYHFSFSNKISIRYLFFFIATQD